MSNSTSQRLLTCCVAAMMLLITSKQVLAQQQSQPVADKLVRELRVPFDNLDVLLGPGTDRVFTTRAEFAALVKAAKIDPAEKLPHDQALIQADYQINLLDGRAVMRGDLVFDLLKDQPQIVAIPLQSLGLRTATLDGKPAVMSQQAGQEQVSNIQCLMDGAGSKTLSLEMVSAVQTDAAQQTIQFGVPIASSSKIQITVNGNVEIKSGARVIRRDYLADSNQTQFQIVPTKELMTITMSLNNKQRRDQDTVLGRAVLISEVTAEAELLHASLAMDVVNGSRQTFQFRLDESLDVEAVTCQGLSRWEVETINEQPHLVITLQEPAIDRKVISVRMIRKSPGLTDWKFPTFQPLELAGYTAVIGIVAETRLQASNLAPQSMYAIDSELLNVAAPQSLLNRQPGQAELQAISAYYAPQAGYALSSDFVLPDPELEVDANTLFTFSDAGVTAAGGITLQPMHQTLFNFEFVVPKDWDLQWVRDGVDAELQFERFAEPNGTRVRVRLRKGLASAEATTVWFEAKHVPPNWFANWDTQSLQLPSFPVSKSDVHRGVLSIKPIDDLEATATQLTNLILDKDTQGATVRSTLTEDNSVLDSFRYEADDWQAAVEVARSKPRTTARIMNFVRIGTEAWTVHNELIFLVEQARTATLQFSLPGDSPEEVLIGALDGVGIKESTSEVIDDRRVWTVVLDQPRSGSLRLTVDYTQNAEQDNIENVTLPTARALGSEYQTGAIAVEGDADLETTIEQSPRAIDIGEVFDAEYQLGNRLIGVYGYVAEQDQVIVSIKRRAIEALPATIVQRAEIVAQVSTYGRCQCAARFALKTKSSQIEVRLPKDASLWAVLLGGKPALAQGDDGQVLIAMPADVTNPLRDLQVVYEMPVKSITLEGKMRLQGPALAERSRPTQAGKDDASAELRTIPVANLKWEVYLPQGYQVTTIDGRLWERESSTSTSPLGGFMAKAYLFGGAEQAATIRNALPQPDMGLARSEATMLYDMETAEEEKSEMMPSGGEGSDPFGAEMEMPTDAAKDTPADDPFGDAPPAPAEEADSSQVRRPQSGMQATPPPAVNLPAAPQPPGAFGGGQQAGSAVKKQLLGINRSWAMESLRCLPIDLSAIQLQQSIQWTSLGNRNEVEVVVLHRSRYQGIVVLIGLIAVFGGLTRKTFTQRLVYLVLLVSLSLIVPVVMGAATQWQWTQAALLAAAVGLLILYQFQGLAKAIGARATQLKCSAGKLVKRFTKRSVKESAAALLVLCTLPLISGQPAANAQETPDPNPEFIDNEPLVMDSITVGSTKQWDGLMKAIEAMQPSRGTVAIPDDAIVVPYDPDQPSQPADTDTLLVPAKLYQQLLQISHEQNKPQDAPSPLSVAWSDVKYTMTIGGDQTLEIVGKLRLRQFAKKPMGIPLALSGCVIEQATLSGKPARLRAVRPKVPVVMQQAEMQQQAAPTQNRLQVDAQQIQVQGPGNGLMILYTDGAGDHELVIKLRLGLEKSGGWRIADAVLPAAPAAALSIQVPNQDTEVFLDGKLDRNDYLTKQANEVLETSLASDGRLRLRWRDKITEADVDQGLVVGTDAVFDVQEDMTRLVWKGTFEFRRGQRESFSIDVPSGYLVQKVLGNNVRGWAIQQKENLQQLNVELLKAAVDKETLTVIVSSQHAILEGESAAIEVPNLIVPDAMLQQGQLLVRSSSLLKTRSGVAEGLGRVDIPNDLGWFAPYNDNGPLPLQNFQAYRYARPRYRLPINVDAIPVKASATVQSVLRLSERSSRFESRIRITAKDRPLFVVQCLLPSGLEINPPQYSGAFQWALVEQDNGQSRLDLFMADGELGQFDIVIDGEMPLAVGQATQANPMAIDLPKIDVLNMDRQTGQLAFQIDPAYDITTAALQNCQRLNLNAVNSWLSGRQRQLARLVIGYQNNNYSGQVRVTPRTPRVNTWLVSNIKVTDRALEETIYIEANITSAGIDQYQFSLPARLANARIEAPGLRRKTVEPIANSDPARVRVTLDLQEAIMGQFAIIVQNDRLLGQGSQDSPVAVIETGQTSASYITLENASRDELLTDQLVSVEELEQSELAKIARLSRLAEKASMVFRIRSNQDDAPLLTYQTKTRGVIETSGARIGLAQTVLVVDQYGAYRATQEYRVQNRTEPFLAVQIPAGAALWTVQVAGESVKPSRNAAGDMLIPLIKTAEGDLDYAVILKYGGQMNRPGKFSNVAFPLMKTVNINVERSQVRLRLPKDMQWFDFQGTLGQVGDDNELIAGVVEYRTEQIAKMTQLLGSKKGEYTKARAQNNLKLLNAESQAFNDQIRDNRDLQEQIANNTIAIQEAEQQLQDFEDSNKNADAQFSNRLAIDEFFREQRNGRSLNVASSLGNNFSVPVESSKPGGKVVGDFAVSPQQPTNRFGTKWFADNDLSNADAGKMAENKKLDTQLNKGKSLSKQFKQPARKRNNAPVAKNGAMEGDEKSAGAVQLEDLQKKLEVQQQISGDYRAQVDRYSRQLESQQLQRGGVALGQNAAAPNMNDIGLDFSGPIAQSGQQLQQQAGQVPATQNYLNTASPGFLGSLDIEMPAGNDETTTEYLFTTPGGDLELSARSVSMQDQWRLISVAAVLIGLLVILFASRVIKALRQSAALRMIGAVLMALIGLASVINNTLPLFGLLLILAAATYLITPKSIAAPQEPAA